MFYYFSIFTNSIYVNCVVRNLVSSGRQDKEVTCMCASHVDHRNYHITLHNYCFFVVTKIRKGNSIIFNSVYKFSWPSKLSSSSVYLRFMIEILFTDEVRNITYISCVEGINDLSSGINTVILFYFLS